jgi:hypothetical protein
MSNILLRAVRLNPIVHVHQVACPDEIRLRQLNRGDLLRPLRGLYHPDPAGFHPVRVRGDRNMKRKTAAEIPVYSFLSLYAIVRRRLASMMAGGIVPLLGSWVARQGRPWTVWAAASTAPLWSGRSSAPRPATRTPSCPAMPGCLKRSWRGCASTSWTPRERRGKRSTRGSSASSDAAAAGSAHLGGHRP